MIHTAMPMEVAEYDTPVMKNASVKYITIYVCLFLYQHKSTQ